MPSSRYLPETIDTMLRHVPDDSVLKTRLESIKDSVVYAAPEDHARFWGSTAMLLKQELPAPIEDWHYLVLAEFSEIPIGELKAKWKQIRENS